MTTKAQKIAAANLSAELKKLQEEFYHDWIEGSLPKVWNQIPELHPPKPDRTKVTLTLDADMVKWFRGTGRGYHARINSILRVYWHALLSGQIKSHWDAEAVAPREYTLLEGLLNKKISDIQRKKIDGLSEKERDKIVSDLQMSLRTIQDAHRR